MFESAVHRIDATTRGHASSAARRVHLRPGDRIVFRGSMRLSREHWELEVIANGFVPDDSITRRTRLIVAPGPSAFSWARITARLRGVPVVDEAGLHCVLGLPAPA
jgi:hypothetical protein